MSDFESVKKHQAELRKKLEAEQEEKNALIREERQRRLVEEAKKVDQENETKDLSHIYNVEEMAQIYEETDLWTLAKIQKEKEQKRIAATFTKVMTEQELEDLREVFRLVDLDDSGEISKNELGKMMTTLGMDFSNEELNDMMEEVDTDGSGDIDFREFVSCMSKSVDVEYSGRELKKAFQSISTYDDGLKFIHSHTMREAFEIYSKIPSDRVEELITQIDPGKSGKIQYVKFVNMLSATASQNTQKH